MLVLETGGRLGLGEEVYHSRAMSDPEDWVWGKRESGDGPQAAYMGFCQAFAVVEKGVST